jgi:MoxR-like ATPase
MASPDSGPPALTRGPGPYPLVVGHASLIGREQERRFLQRVLEEARQATRLVFVSGEPGVGKSRLLAEVARQAVGWRVLRGGAYEA